MASMLKNDDQLEIADALDRISHIHEHLAKGEIYRGFRALPVALSGVAGLGAAMMQPLLVEAVKPESFLHYWVFAGLVCGLIGVSEIILNYCMRDSGYSRRITRCVVGQFVPCIFAAIALTLALSRGGTSTILLLPGLWALLFSLGVFASRPFMPRASGWVALYYLLAGAWLLFARTDGNSLSGWRVGGVFGIGQLATAAVLYWNLERKSIV